MGSLPVNSHTPSGAAAQEEVKTATMNVAPANLTTNPMTQEEHFIRETYLKPRVSKTI